MAKKAKNTNAELVELKSKSLDEEYIEPVKEEEDAPTKIQLFDIIKAIFVDRNFIWNLTESTATQNIFMVNRRLAIQFPMEANFFNRPKTNAFDVLKFWSDFLYNGSRSPAWIYTKAEQSKSKQSSYEMPSSDAVKKYADKNWLSSKDIDAMMRFFPERTIELIKDYDTITKATI